MFGLMLGILTSIGSAIGNAQYRYETKRNRSKAKSQGRETYLDCFGAERLTKDGRYVFRHTLNYGTDGDYVMEDSYGNVLHNYSQVQRSRDERINIELAKRNGNSVYQKGRSNNDLNNIHQMRVIYIDIATGRELFVQGYNQFDFYRDLNTGEYIRLSDSSRRNVSSKNLDEKKCIDELNARWNSHTDKEKKDMLKWEMKKYDCDTSVLSATHYPNPIFHHDVKITVDEYNRIINQF